MFGVLQHWQTPIRPLSDFLLWTELLLLSPVTYTDYTPHTHTDPLKLDYWDGNLRWIWSPPVPQFPPRLPCDQTLFPVLFSFFVVWVKPANLLHWMLSFWCCTSFFLFPLHRVRLGKCSPSFASLAVPFCVTLSVCMCVLLIKLLSQSERKRDWLTGWLARMPSAYRITINHRVLIEQRDHTVCSCVSWLHRVHSGHWTLNTHTGRQSEITAGLGEWGKLFRSFIHSPTKRGKKCWVQRKRKGETERERKGDWLLTNWLPLLLGQALQIERGTANWVSKLFCQGLTDTLPGFVSGFRYQLPTGKTCQCWQVTLTSFADFSGDARCCRCSCPSRT